jgi:hypothetical protein
MAFLENVGPKIVDAVLTDEGRRKLALGDGSFRPSRFILGDDEINYGLYSPNGGVYSELDITRTPVFESVTNNTTAIRHRLTTFTNQDILYLPTVRLVKSVGQGGKPMAKGTNAGFYVVLTTQTAADKYSNTGLDDGFIQGQKGSEAAKKQSFIVIDHGINTTTVPSLTYDQLLSTELQETAWLIQMDDRYGELLFPQSGGRPARAAFIGVDDDDIASYYVVYNSPDPQTAAFFNGFFEMANTIDPNGSPISGARGPRLYLPIAAKNLLTQSSKTPYTQNGKTLSGLFPDSTNALAIDSTITCSGITTGIRIDIPVRFIREA